MSVRVSTLVWDTDFPTQSMKLVALKLADNSSDNGDSIYPAKDTIARMTGCSRSTVHSVVSELIECGLLVVVQMGGHGPGDTTQYRFDMTILRALAKGDASFERDESDTLKVILPEGPEFGPLEGGRVQPLDVRVQPLDKKGPTIGPEPSLNRQEPSGAKARTSLNARAPSSPKGSKRLILAQDHEWASWMAHCEQIGAMFAKAMADEGGMVVFTNTPYYGCRDPELPPLPQSPSHAVLHAEREDRLSRASRQLTAKSKAMTGEAA